MTMTNLIFIIVQHVVLMIYLSRLAAAGLMSAGAEAHQGAGGSDGSLNEHGGIQGSTVGS